MSHASAERITLPIVDGHGASVALGPRLARGGEGGIYPIVGRPDTVAKIYHETISPEKAAKLTAMAQLATPRLRAIAAWPSDTLHHVPGGPIRGILMPAVLRHQEIHVLYSPKSRLREYPDATLPFLLHVATNLARAFAAIHEGGHVIGDVNHGSVLVAGDGTVKLVDCDSFQIAFGGRQLLCTVGMPTHTPPELQGRPLGTIVRTPNHDAFGLAVLIFQLLFLGRHPFAGTFLGSGEPSLEKAIEEYRFAYGPGAAGRQMRQPPATPPLDSGTPALAALFERAFARAGQGPAGRPAAREWVATLAAVAQELTPCGRHSGHFYARGLAACPWCAIESLVGMTLFNVAVRVPRGVPSRAAFDLDAHWAAIEAVADPGPASALSRPANLPKQPSAEARAQGVELRRLALVLRAAVGVGAVTGFGGLMMLAIAPVAFWVLGLAAVSALLVGVAAWRGRQRNATLVAAQRRRASAQEQLQLLGQRQVREAGNREFLRLRTELAKQREAYRDLPATEQRLLQDLASGARQRQLTLFLERQRIASAAIPNIGQGRKATLQSFNIETAADITKTALLRVPGFGPTLTGNLLAWRATVEGRFVYNGQQTIDPDDRQRVEREIATQRVHYERALAEGAEKLRCAAQRATLARTALAEEGTRVQRELAQAEADLGVLR